MRINEINEFIALNHKNACGKEIKIFFTDAFEITKNQTDYTSKII